MSKKPELNNETEIVFSGEFKHGFTSVPNDILISGLDDTAIGLYVRILRFASIPNWKIYQSSFINEGNKKDKISRCINLLIKAGYLKKEYIRDENGKMKGVRYIVYYSPQPVVEEEQEEEVIEKQETPKKAETVDISQFSPKSGNTEVGNTATNNKDNNKKDNIYSEKSKKASKAKPKTPAISKDQTDAEFEKLWLQYPKEARKGAKTALKEKYHKYIKACRTSYKEFSSCMDKYIKEVEKERSNGFVDRKYMHFSRFLNGEFESYIDFDGMDSENPSLTDAEGNKFRSVYEMF